MMIPSNAKKRICMFCFYDRDGIVDDYVLYYLNALKNLDMDIMVVCNGNLTDSGKKQIEKISQNILVRENKGFDAWAHKTAIETIGWEQLANYDEMLITNTTVMGPLKPLDHVFELMSPLKLDFWGITKHLFFQENPFECKYGFTPEHIQSYFIVFNKRVLQSQVFKDFWTELPELNNYNEAVGQFELVLTRTLSDAGFTYDSYIDANKYGAYTAQAIADYPVQIMEEDGCPFFKRRIFFNDYYVPLNSNAGQQSVLLYQYLKKEHSFYIQMFWSNMLRTCHISDLLRNVGLVYIFPEFGKIEYHTEKKVVFVLHLYYEDLFDKYLSYLDNFPNNTDVLITTDTGQKQKKLSDKLEKYQRTSRTIQILRVENRGRDMSALWVALKDYLSVYDYVCFIHDKKVLQITPGSVGDSWGYKLLQNTVGTKELINSVLQYFDKDERLGMLVPPAPIHGQYIKFAQNVWTTNFKNTLELAAKLGIHTPMCEEKDPISAIGNCFWFKTAALSNLFNYTWRYEDFPSEPLPEDGSISHAIERIYSFVAQENGYYTGLLLEQSYAKIEYLNLEYYLKNGYISNENSGYTKYLEREVRKYYKQTSLKWQIIHRICRAFGLKEKPLNLDN